MHGNQAGLSILFVLMNVSDRRGSRGGEPLELETVKRVELGDLVEGGVRQGEDGGEDEHPDERVDHA